MAFRQEQPIVPCVLDQSTTGFHQPLLQARQRLTRPSFCTTASERVYITATDCEIKMDGTKGLQAAGTGGL